MVRLPPISTLFPYTTLFRSIEQHADVTTFGLDEQLLHVSEGAEVRMHVEVVGDVVAPIRVRRWAGRIEPDGVDAEPLQMVEARDEPGQVADAVAVRVGVGARVDLVDHRALPPRPGHQTDSRSRSRC